MPLKDIREVSFQSAPLSATLSQQSDRSRSPCHCDAIHSCHCQVNVVELINFIAAWPILEGLIQRCGEYGAVWTKDDEH